MIITLIKAQRKTDVTTDVTNKKGQSEITLSLYVGGAGAVKVALLDGTALTYAAPVVGRHPMRVKRVFATGTTATGLIGEV